MKNLSLRAIVLAAGKSTRFNTKKSKLLYTICGRPMMIYPLKALESMNIPMTLVLGHQADQIQATVEQEGIKNVSFIVQQEQRGTGHAVECSRGTWDSEHILILYGDMPLISTEIIEYALSEHTVHNAAITFLTSFVLDPTGYGRVIEEDGIISIVEEKNCTDEQRSINRINAGVYVIKRSFLEAYISTLTKNAHTGEFYLVDLVKIASQNGFGVQPVSVPYDSIRGVNTMQELWNVDQIKRSALIKHWMIHGVRFELAQSTHVDSEVQIGSGTVIGASVHLLGKTVIGQDCLIGPFSILEQANLADQAVVHAHTIVQHSRIESNAQVGPFARLRNNVVVHQDAQIGNFVEIKNSSIGQDASAKHLAYLGDAVVGASANIGAGTITCNYDGVRKHQTVIQDNAFVGSNNTLVAPVTIGKNSYTAAGSTITADVPEDSLALGRSRQVNKEGYAQKIRALKTQDDVDVDKSFTCPSCFSGAVKTHAEQK